MPDSMPSVKDAEGKLVRVLICDDSKVVRLTAKKMLKDHFDLVFAEDGQEAWDKIQADNTIQMVFTDLKMPNMDGFELISLIRKSETESIRNLPVVVITGSSEDEGVRKQIFEVGATDFVSKPFKASTLIARSQAHTSYRKVKRELQESCNLDALTGVLNQLGVEEQLKKDCAFVNRHTEKIAVMMFEVDGFDEKYDIVGKAGAERVIKEVAKALVGSLRKEDSVGRIGLARFFIILPMANNDGVHKLARRLTDHIRTFKLKLKSQEVQFTASAGVVSALKGCKVDAISLLDSAQKAIDDARKVGVDQVQMVKLEPDDSSDGAIVTALDTMLNHIDVENITHDDLELILPRLMPLLQKMSPSQRSTFLSSF